MNALKSVYVYVSILLILKSDFGFSKSVWRSSCPRLQIPNARVKLQEAGRFARVKCRRRYMMIGGDRRLSCIWNQWSGRIPSCIRNGCKEVKLVNGDVMKVYEGALIHFNCKPGYVLEGSSSLFCDGSTWNASSPNCLIPPPKDDHTFCSFEFEKDEMCGWKQDHLDNGNWIRTSAALSLPGQFSIRMDNTLKTKQGHYIQADQQAITASSNFVARIFSPILEVPSLTPSCIIFYYLILGPNSGTLNVYLKPEDVLFELLSPMTSLTGSNVHSWKIEVLLLLPPVDDFFQVVFEAKSEHPLRQSSIAVDDFQLTSGEKCIELNPQFNHKQTTEQEETTYISSTVPADTSTEETKESIFTDDLPNSNDPALTEMPHTPIATTKSSDITYSNADQYTSEQIMLQSTEDTPQTPKGSTISRKTYLNPTTRFIRFHPSLNLPETTEFTTLKWKTLTPYIPSMNKSEKSKSTWSSNTLLSTLVYVKTFSNEPPTATTMSTFQHSNKRITSSKNNEDSNSIASDYYKDSTNNNAAQSVPLSLTKTAPNPKRIMIITGVITGLILLSGATVAVIWTKRKRSQQTAEDANFQRFENENKADEPIQESEASTRKCFSTSYRILENNSHPSEYEGSVP